MTPRSPSLFFPSIRRWTTVSKCFLGVGVFEREKTKKKTKLANHTLRKKSSSNSRPRFPRSELTRAFLHADSTSGTVSHNQMQASMSARCAPRAAAASAARANRIGGVSVSRPTAFASSASRRPKLFAAAVEADTTAPEPAPAAAADVEAKEEEVVVITEAGRLANAEPERRRGNSGGGRGGGRGRGRRTPTLKTEDIVAGLQVEGKVVRGLFSCASTFALELFVDAAAARKKKRERESEDKEGSGDVESLFFFPSARKRKDGERREKKRCCRRGNVREENLDPFLSPFSSSLSSSLPAAAAAALPFLAKNGSKPALEALTKAPRIKKKIKKTTDRRPAVRRLCRHRRRERRPRAHLAPLDRVRLLRRRRRLPGPDSLRARVVRGRLDGKDRSVDGARGRGEEPRRRRRPQGLQQRRRD